MLDASLQAFGGALPATAAAGADAELKSELIHRADACLRAFLDLALGYRVANADVHPGSLLRTAFNGCSFMRVITNNHRFERTSET